MVLYDCLRFIGWWPTISEQAYFQFLEKLSKAKQIQYHEETNEIQLTKEGQLFLKEHHFRCWIILQLIFIVLAEVIEKVGNSFNLPCK